jgi:hypothetical protein
MIQSLNKKYDRVKEQSMLYFMCREEDQGLNTTIEEDVVQEGMGTEG